jgi:hypothetical protein
VCLHTEFDMNVQILKISITDKCMQDLVFFLLLGNVVYNVGYRIHRHPCTCSFCGRLNITV